MSLAGVKILVVDDEPDLREVIRDELNFLGAEVTEAENGKIAFDKYTSNSFDAVLSDFKMPVASGLDLLNQIRSSNKKRPIFIFLTGFADHLPSELYTKGASAVISKPYHLASVLETLQRLLAAPHQRWNNSDERLQAKGKIELILKGSNVSINTDLVDLSRGGIFVSSLKNLPAASELVTFIIDLLSTAKKIHGHGIVRWIREKDSDLGPRGFGVEFTSLDPESIKALEIFLKTSNPKSN